MDRMNRFNAMVAYEQNFETRKWMGEIPHLNFKEHWKVKVIPPFGELLSDFGLIVKINTFQCTWMAMTCLVGWNNHIGKSIMERIQNVSFLGNMSK